MLITPLYAGLAALVFIFLSIRTLMLRRRLRVAIGDSDQPLLLRATRVHSNFAEYVPLAIILLYFLEVQGAADGLIHGLAIALLLGRLLHAYGVSQVEENYRFRVIGMGLTFLVVVTAATRLIMAATIGSF
ncbi:MAPEG family protein [Motiliproteus sp. MSK22-1]|uniref:MAPEG family protein n=1 Tax=Motiliproteus sp. MSK22-1 TaxID=1897630 RepID=UPI00097755E9|nr:MAPEG family protein [Motiliproteus sp. MSK22-1]OMH39042.1 glutathione metabolism protein [Motiliproteus sp. MSK22-1]